MFLLSLIFLYSYVLESLPEVIPYLLTPFILVIIYVTTPLMFLLSLIFITIFSLISSFSNQNYIQSIIKLNLPKFFGIDIQKFYEGGLDLFFKNFYLNLEYQLNFFLKNLENLKINFLNTDHLKLFSDYLNYPIFIYSGLFFFLTTFISLVVLNYLGLYGVFILNLISLTILWVSIVPYAFNIFSNNIYYYVSFGKWMYLTINYKVSFDFLIDITSISFSFLTLTIAQFVYIYTFAYFRYEPLVDRLILFLNMFIISMVFLVSSGNLVNLFLGWEMIGLTSFFLINF
jgi:hypothetical protein